jgi:UDP-glucuronate decarboxylase
MATPDELTGPVNLGNPTEITVLELAEKIIALTNSSSQIVRKPLPEDDPKQRRPDTALAQSALGWRPTMPLDEGLKRTVIYFEGLLRISSRSPHRLATRGA